MSPAATQPRVRAALALAAAAVALSAPAGARAQEHAGQADFRARAPVAMGDTLYLGALQAEAVRRDPRGRQLDLLGAQAELRLRDIDAELLPALGLNGQAQYQSDVASLPIRLPGGATVPSPAHDVYDAHLDAWQRLYDPTRGARRELERARLAEGRAHVRAALFAVREGVNDAYFSALQLAMQRAELEAGIGGLEARLDEARSRVRLGSALPSESAILEAELLRRRQAAAELAAARDAALAVLGDLTGRTVDPGAVLAIPELAGHVERARAAFDTLRARPEYERFARSRDVLAVRRAVAASGDGPRVSALGRAGYGRPGLNPLARDFDAYWLAGVQVEWSPWSWGATRREREALTLEAGIVATEEEAFTEAIRRGAVTAFATIGRLERTLAADDTIVALREEVLREARLRFGEGVITAAELVDRESELLAARLARATRRVELASARARLLTLLGLEIPR